MIKLRHPDGSPKKYVWLTRNGRREQWRYWEDRLKPREPTKQRDSLLDVFSFGHPFGESNRGDILELQRALNDGELSVQHVKIPTFPVVDGSGSFFSGADQQSLCVYVAFWLKAQELGWTATTKDLYYAGGRADVAALHAPLFIECGCTQAHKVLEGCRQEQHVMVVSYSEPPVGFLFSPGRTKFLFKRDVQIELGDSAEETLRRDYLAEVRLRMSSDDMTGQRRT